MIEQLKDALPPISEVVALPIKKAGGELAGPCPFCGGTDRFYLRPDGSFGCRQCGKHGGDVIDFHKQLEQCNIKALAEKYLSTIPAKNKLEKAQAKPENLIECYPYVDERDNLLFEVCRYEEPGREKTFRQRHYQNNKAVYHLQGIRRVLYNLPGILEEQGTVFFVEGEKDAGNLIDRGLTATTSPMGAASWKPEYAQFLKGKHVAILPDNDLPGKQYADKVSRDLLPVCASVKVINLPGLKNKGDVSDWLQAGNTVQDLLEIAEKAEVVRATISQEKPSPKDTPKPVNHEAIIHELAELPPVEYELKRKKVAEQLGIRATVLDQAVKDIQKGQVESDLPFDEPDVWSEEINPDQLLSEISGTVKRFIVCSQEIANTVALWAAMTWFIDSVHVAPLAVITAPEKRCGKTQLLTLLGKLSAKSITASSISAAALYRTIEKWNPTLMIDEVDACLKDNEELRGIINAGHTRDSAFTIRCVGENHEPKKFNLWGAKALSGIGRVAGTLMDRAVILELRRKLPHEKVDRLRHTEVDLFSNLRSKLARFTEDYSEQVRQARPPLPESLNDRAQDNWEPLLAIAMVAGGEWLEIGTMAALTLSGTESVSESLGTELLADIQEIFEMKGVDKISTAELITSLCEDDEKVWPTYNRGKQLSPRQLATRLKSYGISSNTIRIGTSTPKGFKLDQFAEAFSRYLASPPSPSATPPQPLTDGRLRVADEKQRCGNVADEKQRCGNVADKRANNLPFLHDCCGVADRTPPEGESKTMYEEVI